MVQRRQRERRLSNNSRIPLRVRRRILEPQVLHLMLAKSNPLVRSRDAQVHRKRQATTKIHKTMICGRTTDPHPSPSLSIYISVFERG